MGLTNPRRNPICLTSSGDLACLMSAVAEAAGAFFEYPSFQARMFSFDSLGHINVVVPDLEDATRFYQTLFNASVEKPFRTLRMWVSRGRPVFCRTRNPST